MYGERSDLSVYWIVKNMIKIESRVCKGIGNGRLILFKCGVYGERFDLRLYMTEKIFDSKELNPAFVRK